MNLIHDSRLRLRTLFYHYGKTIIFVSLAILVIVSFLRSQADIDSWVNGSLLNLATELVGALLVIYLGIDRLREQRDVQSIPELPKRQVIREIAQSKEYVQILESWSYLFVDSRQEAFRKSVLDAIQSNANVQIMILRPGSPGLLRRAEELKEQKVDVIGLHQENLRWLHRLQEEVYANLTDRADRFEVRFRDELPESTMYAVDKVIYHAPFTIRGRTDIRPHLRIHIEDPDSIGWGYIDDFNRKWGVPTAALDDYMMIKAKVNGTDYWLYFELDDQNSSEIAWFAALELKFDAHRKRDNSNYLRDVFFDGVTEYEIVVEEKTTRCVCFPIQDNDLALARRKLSNKYGKDFKNFSIIRLKQIP